jgi:2-octaprenyl-6-methoxyphenol hydroxylase
MTPAPLAILGGGPVGLALALLLARRHVASVVLDARGLDEARRDGRLLALSRGTLETLGAVANLPAPTLAPIDTVVISSRGEFGRAVLDGAELDGRALGATVRYGELLGALDAAAGATPLIELRRSVAVSGVQQAPAHVAVHLDDGATLLASIAVNAEGARKAEGVASARHVALVADVEIDGPAAGVAFERFTREGPLALLPLPGGAAGARRMALVWCMPSATGDRRDALSDTQLLAELQSALGSRNGRLRSLRGRGRYPLVEQARDAVREHRIVHVGNAAQTLHPVAGQGLNLGVRDAVALAESVAAAVAAGEDPAARLADYERRRRADRLAIRTLTRAVPGLFATSFAPVAAARSLGLTALSMFPDLRAEFARLLMFGVRS